MGSPLVTVSFHKSLAEVADEHRTWATSDQPRIPIGYEIMDSRTDGGAAYGELVLFTARSQVGKTVFACNVINNNAGTPTVFFSLEMHGRYIGERLACIHTNTPTTEIRRHFRETGGSPAMELTVQDFPNLSIVDKPGISLRDMHVALQEAADDWGERPKLVVVDFLELMGGNPALEAVSAVDKMAQKVKNFAREEDVVLLCLHQVGRGAGGEGHMPLSLTSGRYGGEVSADYVLGAFRPCLAPGISQNEFMRSRDQYYVQFLKTRGGSEIYPQGMLHRLNPDTMRITPWVSYPPAPQIPVTSEQRDDYQTASEILGVEVA